MTEFENNPYALDTKSRLETVSWYLLATGIMCIVAAALFLFLREIRYQDYVLNGVVLGRYLLLGGAVLYVVGRGLSYYGKFRRRQDMQARGREQDDRG
jgi:hypothetical protein